MKMTYAKAPRSLTFEENALREYEMPATRMYTATSGVAPSHAAVSHKRTIQPQKAQKAYEFDGNKSRKYLWRPDVIY